MTYSVRETCRLCDARLPEERVLDLGETPLANALLSVTDLGFIDGPVSHPAKEFTAPLYLKQCSACGHVQLPVVVDPKLLFPESYPYASSTGAAMREHLDAFARDVPRPNDQKALEIGSNDGYLLRKLSDEGMMALGVDPALSLARETLRANVVTLPFFFEEATAGAICNSLGMFDLVVANNVFAHADDLAGIVRGIGSLLEHDGRFVFECGWLLCVLGQNNFPACYHEHLSQHALGPLVSFFERHGMCLYDANVLLTQGGSFRAHVSWEKQEQTESLRTMLAQERDALSPERLARWQSRAGLAAVRFANKLCSLKTEGKTMAGYGCSAKSATLLHVAGIGREVIDYICDDNPLKQGRYSPGFHIPIVPGSWLEEKQPDYCVSLSGNFSEAFKAAHPEFKGEWIEPDLGGVA